MRCVARRWCDKLLSYFVADAIRHLAGGCWCQICVVRVMTASDTIEFLVINGLRAHAF